MFAFRIAYYEEPLGTVLVGLVYIPWNIFNMFIMHWVITKMGFLYIEAEVLRSGNDQLLDNLEEGVIIVEETTNDILYYNNAAAGSRRGALPMESDAEIAMDLSKKPDLTTMIAEQDEKRFAKIDKSIFISHPVDVSETIKKMNEADEY